MTINITKSKYFQRISKLLIAMAFVTGLTLSLLANSSGKDGRTSTTSNGCSCHTPNSSSSTTLSVSSESGSWVVDPGSENTFTVTVSNSGQEEAGVNIAVKTSETGETNIGSLAAVTGSGLRVVNGELVHSSPKTISSGSASFEFTWTAPTTPGTYYLRAIGNAVNDNGSADSGDEWNYMPVREVTVKGITLASPDGGEEYCAGSQQTITWDHTGLTNVKIDLSSNGGNSYDQVLAASVSATAESWTWDIPSDFQDGSNYRIRVSDVSNSELSDESESSFSVNSSINLSAQPQDANICTGETLSLSVSAQGAGLSYKWRKNGSNIPNATNATYSKSNVSQSDAGTYDCVISANCGDDVTSETATVTVKDTVSITQDIAGSSVCPGENVTLTVTATGDELEYSWTKNGAPINGAETNEYTLTNIQEEDEATYRCVITNPCGTEKLSKNARIIVRDEVAITEQTADTSVCEGGLAEFYVWPATDDFTYQWRNDGKDILGETDSKLTIDIVSEDSEGTYDCLVGSECGNMIISDGIEFTLDTKPIITKNPVSTEANTGETVVLYVISGNAGSYEWYKGSTAIPNSNNDSLEVIIATESDFASYHCLVTNECGETESSIAEISQRPLGPAISVLTDLIDLSEVLVGNEKVYAEESFIGNAGDSELTITAVNVDNGAGLTVELPELPLVLQTGDKADIKIIYSPESTGALDATITFESNAQNDAFIKIIGEAGTLTFNYNESIDFGEIEVNDTQVLSTTIENTGTFSAKLTIPELTDNSEGFTILSPTESFTLAPNEQQTVEVEFSPSEAKNFSADIKISEIKFGGDIIIGLLGAAKISSVVKNGLDEEITVTPNPSGSLVRIDLGSINSAESVTIFNINGETVFDQRLNDSQDEILWDIKDMNGDRVPTGVYLAVLYTDNGSYYLKIVIN